jgi:hypothetical protein
MTDRWERELEKLRTVSAPAGVRGRVDEGPRGAAGPGPSGGQRVLAGVVAFAFFGAALALAAGALGDGPAPVVDDPSNLPGKDVAILTLQSGDAPVATLTFDGVEAPSQVGSYCWNQPREGGLAVNSCVYNVLTPFEPSTLLQIPSDVAVRIDYSEDVSSSAYSFAQGVDPTAWGTTDIETLPPHDPAGQVVQHWHIEPGVYVLRASTNWHGQDERIDFYFGIQVGSDVDPDGLVLPDLVGMGHQDASLLLEELGLEYGWSWREVPGVELGHVASTDPAAGSQLNAGDHVLLVIATEITPISDGPDALDCVEDEYVAFGGPDARIGPGADAYIRGNLGGIELSDEVVQVRSTGEYPGWNGTWHVIRDGLVIAVVDFESLDGVACRGSGVAGA